LGSIVALSNNDGEIVERYSYDVFGTATIRDAGGSVISVAEKQQLGYPLSVISKKK